MSLKTVSLHSHDGASVYDAIGDPSDYAEWVLKNAGEDSGAVAITNHGNMNSVGSIAAIQKKYESRVKFIYGNELYFVPSLREWRELKQKSDEFKKQEKKNKKKKITTEEDDDASSDLVIEDEQESKSKQFDPLKRRNHIVLNAINYEGLKNLYRLTSKSYQEGFFKKPRIDIEMLREHNQGLIVSTACIASPFSYLSQKYLDQGDERVFKAYDEELFPLMEIFGKDRFFLELQFNFLKEQEVLNKHLIEYSKRTGYKLIVTSDAHYPNPEAAVARQLYRLLGLQMLKKEVDISTIEGQANAKADLYLKNGDQLFDWYKKTFAHAYPDEKLITEAIERSYDIAHNLIEDVRPDKTPKFPKSVVVESSGETSFDFLKKKCFEELNKKNLIKDKIYFNRLVKELKVIKKLGVEDYFLVLKDIVEEVRNIMLLGPGRGSGASSLVNYLLGITLLDPIKHDLLFERFLSLSRKGLPDIDSDIEDKDAAFKILQEKYGEKNVLAVSNFNRLQLKSLIKDISRLFDIPFQEVNELTKIIEDEAKDKILAEINYDQKLYAFTYEKAKEYSPSFQNFLKKYPNVDKHIAGVFGEIKSIGKHAGGIIIVPNAEDHLPIIKIRGTLQSPIVEGLNAQHLQQFGLIKYDLLGLATLRTIRACIENILKANGTLNPTMEDVWNFYNKNLHPDIIDTNDIKVYKNVYHKGRFPAIFQFMEKDVQNFAIKAKPEMIDDISAVTSIFRPGPLKGSADKKYLTNKNKTDIEYGHPILEKILGYTKGILCFQEQFMTLANELAGFSLEESDDLRKLLVKPAKELGPEMVKKREIAGEKFIEGCVKKGLSLERSQILWNKEILGFISYGFVKPHAYAYSYNSYHCAWLFTYHQDEWIKACLETDPDSSGMKNIVKSLGYTIKEIDINLSHGTEWTVKDEECIPPISSVKSIGDKAIEELEKIKPIKSVYDFWNENNKWKFSKFNIRALGNLIKLGAFKSLDCIGEDKIIKNYKQMYEIFVENIKELKKKKGKENLEEIILKTSHIKDWIQKEKFDMHLELTGEININLLISNEKIKEMRKNGINSIDNYDKKGEYWFYCQNSTIRKTKHGREFEVITTLGIDNKSYKIYLWNFEAWRHKKLIKDRIYLVDDLTKNNFGFQSFKGNVIESDT